MSKQHCRTLQVERFFRQCRTLLWHCCRFWQQCCWFRQQYRTKFRPFDNVERNWTCSICFDFVEMTKFYTRILRHCCRLSQQIRMSLRQSCLLLRHCCWCGRGLRRASNNVQTTCVTCCCESSVVDYVNLSALLCGEGAQDFLPDFEPASSCVSVASIYPRYKPISSAIQKARKWIAEARVWLLVLMADGAVAEDVIDIIHNKLVIYDTIRYDTIRCSIFTCAQKLTIWPA